LEASQKMVYLVNSGAHRKYFGRSPAVSSLDVRYQNGEKQTTRRRRTGRSL